jgi:hypothetical protein
VVQPVPLNVGSTYQQVVIVVNRDELADMLLGQPGFEIEKIEDNQSEVHFIFGRKTDFDMSLSPPSKERDEEEKKLFSMQEELRQARRL